MKITGTPPIELTPAAPKRSQSTPTGPRSDAPQAAVVVSASATSASAAQTRADSAVEKRIGVLRTEINGGSYRADLDRLAHQLVDEEQARAGGGHDAA